MPTWDLVEHSPTGVALESASSQCLWLAGRVVCSGAVLAQPFKWIRGSLVSTQQTRESTSSHSILTTVLWVWQLHFPLEYAFGHPFDQRCGQRDDKLWNWQSFVKGFKANILYSFIPCPILWHLVENARAENLFYLANPYREVIMVMVKIIKSLVPL